jgi:hypothetical protein
MNFIQDFKNLCAPALVYVILVVVGIIAQIMGNMATFSNTISTIIVAGLWTWLLNFVCKSGYTVVSWILVFLPILLYILIIVFLIKFMDNMSKTEKDKFVKEVKTEIKKQN